MNIKEEIKNINKDQAALRELGIKIIKEFLVNIKADDIGIAASFTNNNKSIRFQFVGWDIIVVYFEQEDKMAVSLNLFVSPDGTNKSIDIYNAALALHPLLLKLQTELNENGTENK